MNNKARPSNKTNNMYTDKKGNVYQRNKSGGYDNKLNTRPKSQQPSAKPQQRPTQPSVKPQQRPAKPSQPQNRQQLDRSYQNRNQGTHNYNRSQQQRSGGARPSGGGAGEGRRR